MSARTAVIRAGTVDRVPSTTAVTANWLQRKCACGGSAGMTGECEACKSRKLLGTRLQAQLVMGEPGDAYEQEADRMAEQVMRMPEDSSASATGPSEVFRRERVPGAAIARMPILQRAQADENVPATEGDTPKEEGSRCPSWRGDPQSISKRAGEFYARNHLTPPSQATVERIDCEPPRPNGNYGCYVHFSDGLVLRVIVRERDIVVGAGPGPITTEHPPPATPLCFYEYSCPEGDLVLTVKRCQSAKPSGSSGPPVVAQRAAASPAPAAAAAPSIVHDVLSSPGRPLDAATRGFFEPRFGHDFSNVRLHSGPLAEQSARDVNAHAYTVGQHIVFGRGKLSPETQDGRRLLAHELTHVVQQQGTGLRLARQKASLAEKWDAFWGAGPIDAKRAAELSKEALREARRVAAEMGLAPASLHNGPPDAWRHCYWNCRMVQVIGKEDAADIARIHEEHGGNPVAERMMDDWNNEEGRSCSGDCDTCCQQKLDTGKLWVLYGGKVGASKPMPRTPGAIPSGGKYEKY